MTAFSTIKTTATKAKKPIRKRRPRRELPEDLTDLYIDGEGPSPLDVVGGRGGVSNNHEGNKRYWRRILSERPGYKQLGKHDNVTKNEIAQGVYDYIISTGGRFLQLDSKTQKWFNLPRKIGLDKIKQALRDSYVPNFIKGEPVSDIVAPQPTLLPAPAPQTEDYEKQFLVFPQTDFVTTTPSIDLIPILGQPGLDSWTRFPVENPNNTSSLHDDSVESLMRCNLIPTCDNMAQVMDQVESTASQVPGSLRAFLDEQMESAIPSSGAFAAV